MDGQRGERLDRWGAEPSVTRFQARDVRTSWCRHHGRDLISRWSWLSGHGMNGVWSAYREHHWGGGVPCSEPTIRGRCCRDRSLIEGGTSFVRPSRGRLLSVMGGTEMQSSQGDHRAVRRFTHPLSKDHIGIVHSTGGLPALLLGYIHRVQGHYLSPADRCQVGRVVLPGIRGQATGRYVIAVH